MDVSLLRPLYGGPPAGFVAARDALAKELRASGDRDAAAAVKRLRRHTPVQWALNRVAHVDPSAARAFADAADELRAAQAAAVEGREGGDVRAATAALRETSSEVVRIAAGLEAAPSRAELAAALLDVAADPDATAQLLDGVLGSSAPVTVDPFAGLTPPDEPRRRPATAARAGRKPALAEPDEDAAERRRREEEARAERERAEAAVREATEREHAARIEVDEAERRLADARLALADATAERERAHAVLDRLRA